MRIPSTPATSLRSFVAGYPVPHDDDGDGGDAAQTWRLLEDDVVHPVEVDGDEGEVVPGGTQHSTLENANGWALGT